MQKEFYFLSPVEVVKVTEDALEEIARWCGGRVIELESVKKPGTTDRYVWVPTPKEGQLASAYPGMYITKRLALDKTNKIKFSFAVYRRDYFEKNYFDSPKAAVDKTWERHAKEEARKPKPPTDAERLAQAVAIVKELMPGAEIIEVTDVVEEIQSTLDEAAGPSPETIELTENWLEGVTPLSFEAAQKLLNGDTPAAGS